MGVIKRQSIKQSLANYFGVGIGVISTLFIYPLVMEENGLIRFLVAAAVLAVPFASLGLNGLVIRFFPEFQDKEKKHNGFLGLMGLLVLVGFSLFLVFAFIFKERIFDFYSSKEESEYIRYLPFVLPLVLLMALINLFRLYISNFQRVVIPFLVNDLFIKFAIPLILLLFLYGYLVLDQLVWGLVLTYFLILIMLIIYLRSLGEFNLKVSFPFLNPERVKRMSVFGFYGVLGSLGGILAFQIDVFMVGSLKSNYDVSLYSMSLFIANTIDVPMKAVFSIISPIVSKASNDNDMVKVEALYKKSSINLLISGTFLFLLIWLNMDDFFSILPKGDILLEGKYVILFLGLAKVIDQMTSINGHIISYSKYFRFAFYAIILLGILNISLNVYLIPRYDITGAAIATMVSIILYNIIKITYVYIKMKMHPFTRKTLLTFLMAGISFLLIHYLPSTPYALLNLFIKTSLLIGIYGSMTLYLNLSPDITEFVKENWAKIKARF
jgi:O-antigen/teichoic acid export membrane protein